MSIINFIDIETTGFGFKKLDRIVEFAILKYEPFKKEIIDQVVELINPEIVISNEVSKIHGIKNEHVKNKPIMEEKINLLIEMMSENNYVAGHNIDRFDIPFIFQEIIRTGKQIPRNFYIVDTFKLSKKLIPDLKSYSLDSLCDYFEIDKTKRIVHGALIDCELTKEVFNKLRDRFELIDHLIFVDENYIDNKKLNYNLQKKSLEKKSPQYLGLELEEEKIILNLLKQERAFLPWINYKNNEVIKYSVDINDKEYVPLITLTNRYKFISQEIFSYYLRSLGILDDKFFPTSLSLINNIIKYKIKTNGNREIIYLSFNDNYIKDIISKDKNILKDLKQKTINLINGI